MPGVQTRRWPASVGVTKHAEVTTYSTQFALGSTGAPLTVYTAPANLVSVLRDFELFIASGANEPQCLVSVDRSGSNFYFYSSGQWEPNGHRQWQGRIVLHVGDTISVWPGSAAHVNFIFSGYQLSA